VAKRIFEIARELEVKSKAVVEKCQAEGIPNINNHMSSVSAGLEATIREWFSGEGGVATAVETSAAVDLAEVRAKSKAVHAKAKAKPRPEPEPEQDAPAPEPVAKPVAPTPAAPAAAPEPTAPAPEPAPAPQADTPPVVATPAAPEAPSSDSATESFTALSSSRTLYGHS